MTGLDLARIGFALGLFAVGYFGIRVLNLHLPMPRSVSEFLLASFWIYPESVDRRRIANNKIAWFVVFVAAYLLTIAIF